MMTSKLDNLLWIEELLPLDIAAVPKHGGMGYYLDDKLVLILVEKSMHEREHKGVTYPFAIWHGAILPIEQLKQRAFFLKYTFLENHPANKNWLYIPAESENFEEEVREVLREISRRNPLWGLPVKMKELTETVPKPAVKKKKKVSLQKPEITKKQENDFLLNLTKRRTKP